MSAFGGKSGHRADSSASPLMTLFRYSATAVERESARWPVALTASQGVSTQIAPIRGSSSCSDKSALGNTMASDDKKTKTSPAPKNETAVKKEAAAKKKDQGQPGYSRGEGQKPVSKAY